MPESTIGPAPRARWAAGCYNLAMALRIEDDAVVADLQSATLVGKDGSIDWLCLPRLRGPVRNTGA